jgi:hypothetical protein
VSAGVVIVFMDAAVPISLWAGPSASSTNLQPNAIGGPWLAAGIAAAAGIAVIVTSVLTTFALDGAARRQVTAVSPMWAQPSTVSLEWADPKKMSQRPSVPEPSGYNQLAKRRAPAFGTSDRQR